MNDEELYQRAVEELDSEHRRMQVWKRACALSGEDHDEARYLYTSLRVEQMLAEGTDAPVAAQGGAGETPELDDIELEAVELTSLGADEAAAGAADRPGRGTRDESAPEAEEARSPTGRRFDERLPLELDAGEIALVHGTGEEVISAADGEHRIVVETEEVTATEVSPGEIVRHEIDTMIETGEIAPVSDAGADGAERDGIDAAAPGRGEPERDGRRRDGAHPLDDASTLGGERPRDAALADLDWLDDVYRAERRALDAPPRPTHGTDPDTDAFTRELERQAGELPGGYHGGSVIDHDADSPPATAGLSGRRAIGDAERPVRADDAGTEETALDDWLDNRLDKRPGNRPGNRPDGQPDGRLDSGLGGAPRESATGELADAAESNAGRADALDERLVVDGTGTGTGTGTGDGDGDGPDRAGRDANARDAASRVDGGVDDDASDHGAAERDAAALVEAGTDGGVPDHGDVAEPCANDLAEDGAAERTRADDGAEHIAAARHEDDRDAAGHDVSVRAEADGDTAEHVTSARLAPGDDASYRDASARDERPAAPDDVPLATSAVPHDAPVPNVSARASPADTPGEGRGAADEGVDHDDDDEPLELDDGGPEEYAVFVRPGSPAQAVRQGGSWGATLLTLPWLLGRRLVGTAIVYALFAAVALTGLALTSLAWADAGAAATLVTRLACIAFALLAFLGLFFVPFRLANHWREDKLEDRGFELVAYVRANGPGRASTVAERAVDLAR